MDLQGFGKVRKILGDIGYYFIRLPLCALRRQDKAYRRLMGLTEGVDGERQRKVAHHLSVLLGRQFNEKEIEKRSKQYFQILQCDDLDAWLSLFKPWVRIRKRVRVIGGEHFRKIAGEKKGCFLLTAHFGGGFFIFDLVRDLGGKPHGIGLPVRRKDHKGDLIKWIYLKFRMFCVERSIRDKAIFIQRRETKREVLDKLKEGHQVVVFFDVPPFMTKGKMEKVDLLGREWNFPRGFLKMIAGTDIPVVPFFAYLAEDQTRTFCFYPPYRIGAEHEIGPVMQECAKIFESHLLERPEQWFFLEIAETFW